MAGIRVPRVGGRTHRNWRVGALNSLHATMTSLHHTITIWWCGGVRTIPIHLRPPRDKIWGQGWWLEPPFSPPGAPLCSPGGLIYSQIMSKTIVPQAACTLRFKMSPVAQGFLTYQGSPVQWGTGSRVLLQYLGLYTGGEKHVPNRYQVYQVRQVDLKNNWCFLTDF